ncbi:hypothetical protein Pla22_28920 [Rubripirellula amarantea]|uniref:Uncharacterized protein n=1 Tax=Rubripirellula amarantea TaxID=2527999 RepID=A0A5C5WJX2_9BACT|nr:hypothetical protein Pla22_28920 [Rubripirellula amarantea]
MEKLLVGVRDAVVLRTHVGDNETAVIGHRDVRHLLHRVGDCIDQLFASDHRAGTVIASDHHTIAVAIIGGGPRGNEPAARQGFHRRVEFAVNCFNVKHKLRTDGVTGFIVNLCNDSRRSSACGLESVVVPERDVTTTGKCRHMWVQIADLRKRLGFQNGGLGSSVHIKVSSENLVVGFSGLGVVAGLFPSKYDLAVF